MEMFKYVLKRIALVICITFVIMLISFVLIKLLEPEVPISGTKAALEAARREALGYNRPILVQFGIYLKNIFTKWDWGTSWNIEYLKGAEEVLFSRFPPTILLNIYSTLISIPLGIMLGVIAAIYKNRLIDHVISTVVMIFISVPSFVYAFLLQYTLGFRAGLFPVILSSLYDASGSWFSAVMLKSMVLPVIAMSFGSIAYFARFVRAELSESLTSEYMLLARTKGLSKSQATIRHALKNAMVPILPAVLATFLSVLSGSMIIEKIFVVNGVGSLFLQSINLKDYDVFMMCTMFYTGIGLALSILIDLSYGFIDPRIRMGAK